MCFDLENLNLNKPMSWGTFNHDQDYTHIYMYIVCVMLFRNLHCDICPDNSYSCYVYLLFAYLVYVDLKIDNDH